MFVSAFISVAPVIGCVAGVFCMLPGIVVLVQFGVVVAAGVCVVVVPAAVGLVLVTGVPGVVVPVEVVVVVPLFTVDEVDVPFVVVVEVPGGQFCILVVVVVFVAGVVVVVVGGGFVVVFVVVVVCANAGTAILTTSPATEARPRIARELMRLHSP